MCVIISMFTCNMVLNSSTFQVIIAVRPITLVMGKISYEDKARIETLQKLGFGHRTIVAKLPEKGWKLCSVNGLMSVGQQRNKRQVAVGRKQHEQRKMLDTLSCWLAKIEHWLWCSFTFMKHWAWTPVNLSQVQPGEGLKCNYLYTEITFQ